MVFVSPPISYHVNTPIPIKLPRHQHPNCDGPEVLSAHRLHVNE